MQRRCLGSVPTPPADDAGDLAASSFERSLPGHLQVWARARRWQPASAYAVQIAEDDAPVFPWMDACSLLVLRTN